MRRTGRQLGAGDRLPHSHVMSDDFFTAVFLLVYVPLAALAFFFLLVLVLSLRWTQPLSPHKKAVLVSGCDSGIGLRVAEHLYSQGFHVFAACLSLQSQGHRSLCNRREYDSNRMMLLQLDITSRASINAATSFVTEKLKEQELAGMPVRETDFRVLARCKVREVLIRFLGHV